jgi:Putative DNA-binding domain
MMLDEKVHEVLFSDATNKLGEIHWALLKSASLMDSKRWKVIKGIGTIFSTQEDTEFGEEIGSDEIHWWIFKKETDVEELLAKTERTLESVQTLKNASSTLKSKEPESYGKLLVTLKDFAEQHRTEIESLHDYVGWLMKRDVMAPRILFTYRIWGSTRMSDRRVNVEGEENATSDLNKLNTLTEIVLGVRQRQHLVYDKVYNEIGFTIYDGMDPEEISDDTPLVVPERLVIRRTGYTVYGNCETYFTEIRDSLRIIVDDIKKFKKQRNLFQSQKFWREFITKALKVKTCETQLWDFKETLTIWHVKNDPERRKAKITLAADVASFANSSGGVLIIGVTDKREVVGIGQDRELERRLKVAQDVISEHISCDREIALFRQITVGEKDKEKVCLIIVVSQTREVVAVSEGSGRYSYPVRRETGISWPPRDEVQAKKLCVKSDNRNFMHDLQQFIHDN